MSTLLTWIGRGSPGGGTFQYRSTHSAVWAVSDSWLAAGDASEAALYHPFRHCHASFVPPLAKSPSIFPATSAARCHLSPLRLDAICQLRRRDIRFDSFPCCRSTAILSMSPHVGAEIQELRGCALLGGAMTSRCSPSYRGQSSSWGPLGSLRGIWPSVSGMPPSLSRSLHEYW
jgi:hypothetical protein